MAANIGILPWDFWNMTPAEFLLQVKAHNWREDQAWQKLAWQTAHIMNVWLKKEDRVSIDDLLPKKQEPKEEMTDEQMAQNVIAWALALGAEDRRGVRKWPKKS